MSDWDERDFRNSEDNYGPEPSSPPLEDASSRTSWPLFVAAGLALLAGLGLYWLFSEKGPVSVPPTNTVVEAPAEAAEPVPAAERETEELAVDLPALSESDTFIRELLAELSRHPAMTSLLLSDGLVRKIVAAIVNVAEGDNPARHFPYLAPDEPYDVVQPEGPVWIWA